MVENKNMNKFWNNKKVLVTGHTGFVGTWLCMTLKHMGAKVYGIALKEEKDSLYAGVCSQLCVNGAYIDLRDSLKVNEYVKETKPEIVFHLAAYGFVQECYENPKVAYETNVIGTLNLLEAIKEISSVRVIVVASSDKVYHNFDKRICYFSENDNLGGTDPYSCSKTNEDLLSQSYYHSYFESQNLSMVILRPSNILGGGDHNHARLIPYLLSCIENGNSPLIRNPDSIRPWQHILDAVDAYLTVAERYMDKNVLEIFNIGPQKENIITVGEIANILLSFSTREHKAFIKSESTNCIEHNFLGLSTDKIVDVLGWKPKRTINDTLADVYEFSKNEKQFNSFNACMKQIVSYWENV